jgi:acetyl-CoA carboxylase biotin carboxyl carrier protein
LLHEVRAPLVGTFYRAPQPGAEPFVQVGSRVEETTVVGIVETMKLMNPVLAGVAGTVVEI